MLTATLNPVIRFVGDPDGSIAGATGFNNFFNDGVQFSATIEQQPRMINSGLLTNTHSG